MKKLKHLWWRLLFLLVAYTPFVHVYSWWRIRQMKAVGKQTRDWCKR
jgi:hypothetical protein